MGWLCSRRTSQAAAAAEMVAQRYAAAQPHLAEAQLGSSLFITFLEEQNFWRKWFI